MCFFNTSSVPVGVSQVLTSPPAVRMLPASPSLHPHVEGPKSLTKDAQRRGSLDPRYRVKHSDLGDTDTDVCCSFSRRKTPRFSVSARVQHGTEEIYFGHRARAQELRLRVRNCVDNGQRWESRIETSVCHFDWASPSLCFGVKRFTPRRTASRRRWSG